MAGRFTNRSISEPILLISWDALRKESAMRPKFGRVPGGLVASMTITIGRAGFAVCIVQEKDEFRCTDEGMYELGKRSSGEQNKVV